MNFTEAMTEMFTNDAAIRRKCWGDVDVYISAGNERYSRPQFKNIMPDEYSEYSLNRDDFMATDWEIYDILFGATK